MQNRQETPLSLKIYGRKRYHETERNATGKFTGRQRNEITGNQFVFPQNVKVRIVRNKNNTVTTVYSESDEEIRILGKNRFKRNNRSYNRYHRSFSGHWCGFNFGFVNFADADYSNYAASEDGFMDLDYMNSFVMQFNVFQQSINLVPRNNFGIVVGLGLEYQRLRFDNKNGP